MPLYRMTYEIKKRGYISVTADTLDEAKKFAIRWNESSEREETIDYQIVDEPRLVEVPTVEEP